MTDAKLSRGSRLTRSGATPKQSSRIPDAQSSSIRKFESARTLAIGGKQQVYDDGKIRSSKSKTEDPKEPRESLPADSNNLELGAGSENLEASRAAIPRAYDKSSVRNSMGESTSTEANDPKSRASSRKRLKTVAIKDSPIPAKQTTENEKSKADVEVLAKKNRSKISPQNPKGEESTIQEVSIRSKRKRMIEKEKEAEVMPLAARSMGLRMLVGAHVSSAKGQSLISANCYFAGNAFALFLKSQRKWDNPPLQDEHRIQFQALVKEHNYDPARHILPHGSYLVNLAQEDTTKAQKAYTAFLDDLHRCEALGIKFYNFHPGFTGSSPRTAAIARIAAHLNAAHMATKSITPVLETMAGTGNVIGSTFTDLRDIIALVQDKSRVGVCLDTCHVFAAGYDLRKPDSFAAVLEDFESTVGLRYLKAVHLNDSKTPLGSHRDLHANIGTGFLGLSAFWNVMNERRFEGLPMVLETPIDREDADGKVSEDKGVWAREIKLLEGLVGMEMEGKAFRAMEAELAQEGQADREKHQSAFERKAAKEAKTANKNEGKRKRKIRVEASESVG
ncbi:hypothetical protein MMC07_007470 [Pseudocyphellaria aurata]|nr:hypothetical protein [Pseudocyphellaria aurata]